MAIADGEHDVQEPAGRLAQGAARPRLEHNKEEKQPEKVADPVKQVPQGLDGQDLVEITWAIADKMSAGDSHDDTHHGLFHETR